LVSVLSDEPAPPSRLGVKVPRDLETICLKCLSKEPARRYASAEDLANDLRRFQAGEPVQARPVGRMERALKWTKRRPALAALVGVTLLAVVALANLSASLVDARNYAENRREEAERLSGLALEDSQKALQARDFLVSIFQRAETDVKGGDVTVRQLLEEAEMRIPAEFAGQRELRADLVSVLRKVKRGIGRRVPQAMILEVRGKVTLHSHQGEPKRVAPQVLLTLDDRVSLGRDGQVQLVFLSDLHKERLRPGWEVTIDYKGCQPPDAVRERDPNVLMTFVRLPKGTFYMGWDGPKKGVKTQIKGEFEIAVHDVTQGQSQAVMGNNPSWFSRKGNGRNDVVDISDEELKLFPVENVSWNDVQEFLKKLNKKERWRGYVYRLPTEAEWEYACRGGATSEEECSYHFYSDKPTNDLSSEQANFNGNSPFGKAPKGKYLGRPTRVGAYPSNKLGLCDMHGNVFQWCQDALDGGSDRVFRGGCWNYVVSHCRAAARDWHAPSDRYFHLGLRLARVPVPSGSKR
jgi:formylglycine-generating enzyme required for sulfatase activity